MKNDKNLHAFISQYDEPLIQQLRTLLLETLPSITEQLDLPAKMIAYTYGQKYSQLVCTIIPSKKGLKLGFNQGVHLPDPDHLLKGTGKISRYVEITSADQVQSPALKKLLAASLAAYKQRTS